MCIGEAEEPTTEKAKKYVKIYKFLIVIQAIISVLNFTVPHFFLR